MDIRIDTYVPSTSDALTLALHDVKGLFVASTLPSAAWSDKMISKLLPSVPEAAWNGFAVSCSVPWVVVKHIDVCALLDDAARLKSYKN